LKVLRGGFIMMNMNDEATTPVVPAEETVAEPTTETETPAEEKAAE
jgi:hypothetical protein